MHIKCVHSRILFLVLLVSCTSNPEPPSQEKASIKVPEGYVYVPEGRYVLGKKNHPINPQREVELEAFLIGKTEVTNAMWKTFVDSTQYKTSAEKLKNAMVFYPGFDEFEWKMDSTANWRYPNGKSRGGIEDKMNHPVTCISYWDIAKYCEWAEVSLPSLDQWEVACRAGSDGPYHFSGGLDSMKLYGNIWHGSDHRSLAQNEDALYTSEVASYRPNPLGIYDMYGNCFEFCANRPEAWKDKERLACARGGSWWCSASSCNYFNSYDIGKVNKIASFSNHGFRVLRPISD